MNNSSLHQASLVLEWGLLPLNYEVFTFSVVNILIALTNLCILLFTKFMSESSTKFLFIGILISDMSQSIYLIFSVSLFIYKRSYDLDDIKDVVFCHMQTGSQIAFILTTQGLSCALSFDRLFLVTCPLIYEQNRDGLKRLYNKLTIGTFVVNLSMFFASYFDNFEALDQVVLICFMRNSMGKYYNMLFQNLLLCFNVLTIFNYLVMVLYLQRQFVLKCLQCGTQVLSLQQQLIDTEDDNARLTKVLFFYTGVYFTTNMVFSTSLKLLSMDLSVKYGIYLAPLSSIESSILFAGFIIFLPHFRSNLKQIFGKKEIGIDEQTI